MNSPSSDVGIIGSVFEVKNKKSWCAVVSGAASGVSQDVLTRKLHFSHLEMLVALQSFPLAVQRRYVK